MTPRSRVALRAAFVLAVIGLGLASYLTFRHFAAAHGGRSVCSLNLKLNCDVVNTSEYAELVGIPISALGAAFYLAILGLSAFSLAARPSLVPSLLSHLTVFATGSVAYSVFLAGVSHFVIRHWCLFCIGLYAVNVGLLVTAAVGAGIPIADQLAIVRNDWAAIRSKRWLFASLVAAAVVLVGAVATATVIRDQRRATLVSEWAALEPAPIVLRGDEPSRGAADAPIVIVDYFDFLCPHCKKAAQVLERVVREFPGEVRLVLKHVPLDSACNPWANPHPGACQAAAAALCAGKQGHYWEMHDWLFLDQAEIDDKNVVAKVADLTSRIGLDRAALDACVADPATMEQVRREVREGIAELRIDSTPAIFVNGRGIMGALDMDTWRKLIPKARELAAKK
ncbi:MAG: thioredoxin domain-containing protein [bacterium]